MGVLRGSFPMLYLLFLRSLICLTAQVSPTSNSATALDSLLQDYAYRAFVRPRTGVAYDGVVPPNLTGIKISAMRLRSGSLRFRGCPGYKEFNIPLGVIAQPYVERLALVYQNLRNWSTTYYPLVGYTYLAPVVGLLAYDASNLSATNLPELDIRALGDPILIKFSNVRSPPDGYVAQCVLFDLHGLVKFSNLSSGNSCSVFQQGHFSIVVESTAFAPAPGLPMPPPGGPHNIPEPSSSSSSEVWVILLSVLGGIALLILLAALVLWTQKYKQRRKLHQMEQATEVGEALQMTPVGSTKAPAALVTRTLPMLENEYVP